MGNAAERLVARSKLGRPFEYNTADLESEWLQAANERFLERREQIPALGSRAADAGIDSISSFEDLVPLLLTHDTYKSYPRDFLEKGRWQLLGRWLSSLATSPVPKLDYAAIKTQDDWVSALNQAGFPIYASSGTSGKSSFLPATPADRDFTLNCLLRTLAWQHDLKEGGDIAVVVLAPSAGSSRPIQYFRRVAELYGDPARTKFLTDAPVLLHDLNKVSALSKAIANGTASPEDIRAFKADRSQQAQEIEADWEKFVDFVETLAGQRVLLLGFWPQQYSLIERLRARGHANFPLDPASVLGVGGGTKGTNLPADFREQAHRFFGLDASREGGGYGMSELSAALPEVDGRYRLQPWIIPLVLNEEGTALAQPSGNRLEGRFAFLDLALSGRWGGLISGDRVIVDLDEPGFAVLPDSVARYADLRGGSDDRLTCAGTIDAFVRGLDDVSA